MDRSSDTGALAAGEGIVPEDLPTGAESAVPDDTLRAALARLKENTAQLATWRADAEAVLRADSGTMRADTALLRLRSDLQEQVQHVAGSFDSPAFQALIWPESAWGQQLRRDPQRTGADSLEIARADTIMRFLATQGIWSNRAEGDTYFEANEKALLQWFGRFVTDPMRQFLTLWAREQRTPTAGDAAIRIPPDELAARLAAADRFLTEHPDAAACDLVAERQRWYLAVYLGGLPNTPAFDWRTGVLEPELRRSVERYVSEHGATPAGLVVAEYLALLEANGFREAPQVEAFVQDLWKAVPLFTLSGEAQDRSRASHSCHRAGR